MNLLENKTDFLIFNTSIHLLEAYEQVAITARNSSFQCEQGQSIEDI
ncbi:hypothetical protein [Sodalis sp. dw_96]|nr:hypothetical protein [Sodalis sp. dw_96]